MTLATTVSRASYPGTGSVGPFAYPFKINVETDLLVTKRSVLNAETTLNWPADFTVTGVSNASGTISLTVALATGETIAIRRAPPLTQAMSIRNQGAYFPSTIEDECDKLEMQIQSLQDQLSRSVKLSETYDASLFSLSIPGQGIAGQVIGWNTATQMGNLTMSAGAVTLPGSGRTVASLSQYLANNQIFNPLDFAPFGVNIATGVNDATSAILAADAAAVAYGGADLQFPVGTYKTTQNLIVTHRWIGVPNGNNPGGVRIVPTAAVTKALDVRSGGIVDGFYIDGVNTSGKTGIDVGTATLVNIITVQNTMVFNFGGVGGRGIKVAQLVTGNFTNVYCALNYINLHCNGGNTPTDTIWLNCQFRLATTKGVWLETGYGLRFIKPLFEANGEEGLYMQNVGGVLTEVTVDDAWYELNWTSVASGAARHAKFNCFVDGNNGPSGTIRFQHVCAKFLESATEARAIHLTTCIGFTDISTKCTNEVGQIVVDGNSFGNFEAWQGGNGPFLTTVTNTSGGAWNSRSHLEDNIEAAWTTWAPVVTGSGTMTISALVINKARYKIIGKTMYVLLNITFTTATAGGATINVTLPTNARSLDALFNTHTWIDDAAYKDGYAQPDGANPTSSLKFGRKDLAVWGLGAGRGVNVGFNFELF